VNFPNGNFDNFDLRPPGRPQLLHQTNLLKRQFPGGFGSVKNMAFRLLEAWRNAHITKIDIDAALQKRFQIRFDSS
jgi:hypothetical protein